MSNSVLTVSDSLYGVGQASKPVVYGHCCHFCTNGVHGQLCTIGAQSGKSVLRRCCTSVYRSINEALRQFSQECTKLYRTVNYDQCPLTHERFSTGAIMRPFSHKLPSCTEWVQSSDCTIGVRHRCCTVSVVVGVRCQLSLVYGVGCRRCTGPRRSRGPGSISVYKGPRRSRGPGLISDYTGPGRSRGPGSILVYIQDRGVAEVRYPTGTLRYLLLIRPEAIRVPYSLY